jgi:glyoxylase-like metal-dependent hydrolase (beta-lactamase superfamily II)
MQLFPIHAGHFTCDGGALFGVVPKNLWNKVYPCDETNNVQLTLRCLLVVTENRKILIDAGVGNHYTEKVRQNNGHRETNAIEQSLAKAGFNSSEITDVLFTHLHWDHCNGAVISDEGKFSLQFPNAKHWCSKQQWDHSQISNIRERAAYYPEILNFLYLNGDFQLVETEQELFPGISVRLFDGHTPGQMIPFIHSNNKTYVFTADLIPTSANIPLVWIAAYDLNPVKAMEEKEAFLKEVAEKKYLLFFEHDFYTECASTEWTEKGPKINKRLQL